VRKDVTRKPKTANKRIGLIILLCPTPNVLKAITSESEERRLMPANIPTATDMGSVKAKTEGNK
jgi:hypothetical protein